MAYTEPTRPSECGVRGGSKSAEKEPSRASFAPRIGRQKMAYPVAYGFADRGVRGGVAGIRKEPQGAADLSVNPGESSASCVLLRLDAAC